MCSVKKTMVLGALALCSWTVPVGAKIYQLGLVMAEREDRRIEGDIVSATTNAFYESKRFVVIERAQLDKIFAERDLSDFINGSPGDLSNLEGVDMLGLVSYSVEQGAPGTGQWNYYIDVRLTDVKTGQIVGNVSSRRDTFSEPTTPHIAGRFLLQNVREMFPPEGYVVSITGDQVIVDLGVESGLQQGDTLEVIREGEVIFHPVTGKPLPAQEIVVGTLKVVDPANQMSTCKLPKASGKGGQGAIDIADRVRLQPKNQTGAKILKKIPFLKNRGRK
jgi:hypothetical protein